MYQNKILSLIAALCLAWLTIISAFAQNPAAKVDTLIRRAKFLHAKDPAKATAIAQQACAMAEANHLLPLQVKALKLLAYFAYGNEQYEPAENFALHAVELSRKAGVDSLSGDVLVTLGVIRSARLEFDPAIAAYRQAEPYYRRAGLTPRLALLYLDLGVAEKKAGRFGQANIFYFKAADIYLQEKDRSSLAEVYNDIGNCFTVDEDHKKGIDYFKRALVIRESLNDTIAIAQSCNNIGYVLKLDSMADAALVYLQRAKSIREKLKDSSSLSLTLQNMSSAWLIKNNTLKARPLIVRSLKIAAAYDMPENMARGNLDFAELFLHLHQPDSALSRLNAAESVAVKLGIPELTLSVFEIKLKALVALGNFRDAYFYTQKIGHIRDSLFTVAKNRTVNELEVSFQTRQRQKDIAVLTLKGQLEHRVVTQQRWSILVLALAGVLLLILLVALAWSYSAKNKANKRIQGLLQELHHRVKNNLQILSGLFAMQISSLDDETAKSALRENEARLTSMNLIHHKLYSDRQSNDIEMSAYLETLVRHIQASFGKGNAANIRLALDVETMMLPADKAVALGLIINELITNAFKYAFNGSQGVISLSLKKDGSKKGLLYLTDSGPGWKEPQGKQQSLGLKIIRLMALQLDAQLESGHSGPTWYRLRFGI